MRDLPAAPRAIWRAGQSARVRISVVANHGGGYAFRLCNAARELTEECFAQTHLAFVGGSMQRLIARNGTVLAEFAARAPSYGDGDAGRDGWLQPYFDQLRTSLTASGKPCFSHHD